MAKLSYYLKKRKGKEKHPLYLRITHNRKSRYIPTEIYLQEKHWNNSGEVRKTHPRGKHLNNHLTRKMLDAQTLLLKLKERDKELDVGTIKEVIENGGIQNNEEESGDEKDKRDFFEFAEDVRDDFKRRGKYQRWKNYGTVLNKVRDYWSEEELEFKNITVTFLRKLETFLMDDYGNKPNTVKNNMKKIRKLFNDAIREGLVSRELYPFRDYTMPSNPVQKAKLSTDEIKQLEQVETEKGTRLYDTQNIFLFAYYCRGMRFRDVVNLKWANIKEDRLNYVMSKSGKRISLKLIPQALEILNNYKPEGKVKKDYFIFPFLDHRKDYSDSTYYEGQVSSKNALVNKYLKKLQNKASIDENISFHIARHSFAQLANEQELRLNEIQELLGHSDVKTTMKYLKTLGGNHLDNSMEKIFN